MKMKEEALAAFLIKSGMNENKNGNLKISRPESIEFKRELPINFKNCNLGVERMSCDMKKSIRSRLDFIFESANAVVILECDEKQHEDRCLREEVSRTNETVNSLFLGGNQRHVRFIRFNPDSFKIDGKLKAVALEERYKKVAEVIVQSLFKNVGEKESFSIQMMYYDVERETNKICLHEDFDTEIRKICLPPIF